MGNLVNFIEFAKVGVLRHEEEYCLSRGILGVLGFGGKGWLPSTLRAFILQAKQIKRSAFVCHVNTQTVCYLRLMLHYISTWHPQKTSSIFLIFKGYSQVPNKRGNVNYVLANFNNPSEFTTTPPPICDFLAKNHPLFQEIYRNNLVTYCILTQKEIQILWICPLRV